MKPFAHPPSFSLAHPFARATLTLLISAAGQLVQQAARAAWT